MSYIDWVNFGLEVKAARGLLGLTKEGLARAVHLAPATVTRIENGGSDLGSPNAGALLQHYLERKGIEFPQGTLRAAVVLRSEKLDGVAVAADPSMPSGTRFLWG